MIKTLNIFVQFHNISKYFTSSIKWQTKIADLQPSASCDVGLCNAETLGYTWDITLSCARISGYQKWIWEARSHSTILDAASCWCMVMLECIMTRSECNPRLLTRGQHWRSPWVTLPVGIGSHPSSGPHTSKHENEMKHGEFYNPADGPCPLFSHMEQSFGSKCRGWLRSEWMSRRKQAAAGPGRGGTVGMSCEPLVSDLECVASTAVAPGPWQAVPVCRCASPMCGMSAVQCLCYR